MGQAAWNKRDGDHDDDDILLHYNGFKLNNLDINYNKIIKNDWMKNY